MKSHVNIPQIDGNAENIGNSNLMWTQQHGWTTTLTAFDINPNWDPVNLWYKCDQCEYHASTASGLAKHTRKKHKPT